MKNKISKTFCPERYAEDVVNALCIGGAHCLTSSPKFLKSGRKILHLSKKKKKEREIEKRCFRDQSSSEVRKLSHMLAWLPGQSRRCTLNLLNELNLIFPRCYIWDIKSDPSDIPFHRKVVEDALRRHEALQHSISNIGFVL